MYWQRGYTSSWKEWKKVSVKKIEQKTIIFIATLSWKTLLGITDNIVEEVPIIILIDKSWTKLVFSI